MHVFPACCLFKSVICFKFSYYLNYHVILFLHIDFNVVTFDPITASASVLLSQDRLSVTVEHSGFLTWKDYQVSEDIGFRVLCSQEFSSGQYYWEVQPPENKESNWAVGVAYKNHQDQYQSLGQDSSSWCVRWQNNGEENDNNDNDKVTTIMEGTKDEKVTLPKTQVKEGAVKLKVLDQESKKGKLEAYLKNKRIQECLSQDDYKKEGIQALEENEAEENKIFVELKEEKEGTLTSMQVNNHVPKQCSTGFFAFHNQEINLISQKPPGKIGVFLDCDRGWLSFFFVSDFKVKLCYKFQALFSAPLCPAIWLRDPKSTITISKEPETMKLQ